MILDDKMIKFFADYVFQHLGIVYSEANYYQLESRIRDVARHLGFADPQAFFVEIQNKITPEMHQIIIDIATNNETLFFRDPAVFAAIETLMLRKGFSPNKMTPCRVWSAACSTGQEVYSLAMMFQRLSHLLPQGRYEILATDISDRALKQAERATYTQLQIKRGLDDAALNENFDPVQVDGVTQWKVKDKYRTHVTFKKQNLLHLFDHLGPFDLVLCRNVLIYQNPESKKKIISKIYDRLDEGGFLVLGAAESLIGLSDQFEMALTEKATIYKKIRAIKKAS